MNPFIYSLIAVSAGIINGYIRGLSLLERGKALSHSLLSSVAQTFLSAVIAFYLLHWGLIPFILFGVTLIITMWLVIITHN